MPAAQPRILFVSLTNDVGSDRVVMEAGAHGAVCALLGPPGAYAGLPRCVAAGFSMPRLLGSLGSHVLFGRLLRKAVAAWKPDWLVPLDDLAATLSRALGRDPNSDPRIRALIEHSLGLPSGFDAACQRVALMEVAHSLSVRTPRFASAGSAFADPTLALPAAFPLMVKRDQSSGSGGVVRVGSEAELKAALRSANLKTAAKVGLARLGGFKRAPSPVLLQSVVEGRLAMFTAACRSGHMVDGIGFEAVELHPTKQASTVLRCLHDPEMAEAACKLVAALGCSGFVSFDFIVDAAGRAFLIEMNPRPIGSTHLGRRFGHDLMHALLTGEPAAAEATIPADTLVALFPKELERHPASPYLAIGRKALFDVPDNEPAVLAAYFAHLKVDHPDHAGDLDRLSRAMQARTRRLPTVLDGTIDTIPLAS